MTVATLPEVTPLGNALRTHFLAQQASAETLLSLILEQGRAIRAREVEGVLARLAQIQHEMERRGELERDRSVLLAHAAGQLGIPAHTVTLEAIVTLLSPSEAGPIRDMSARLRGMLEEIGREHQINRALMRQELAFLEHLTRIIGNGPGEQLGYGPTATSSVAPTRAAQPTLRSLDFSA